MIWSDIPGWTCADMEALYREMALKYPEGVFVELGVAYGRSLALLAKCCGPSSRIYGVDTWHEFMGQDNLPDDVIRKQIACGTPKHACQANLYMCGVLGRVRLHVGDSAKLSGKFRDRSCDFVFIDANHTCDSVLRDIRAWLPRVRRGGVIAGHDYSPNLFPGVVQAVDEVFGARAKISGVVWRVDVE